MNITLLIQFIIINNIYIYSKKIYKLSKLYHIYVIYKCLIKWKKKRPTRIDFKAFKFFIHILLCLKY